MSAPPLGVLGAGTRFHDRYEIVRCLKSGGMGSVYECVHLGTQKRRALKVMLPRILDDPGMRQRFELEARVTARIESDHIVETFDSGVDLATGAPFLVMELLRGDDLDAIVASQGPLAAEDVVLLLSQAALALDKTHAAGIVHRDLKPQNLFLSTRDDGSPRLKILDFGIVKVVAENETAAKATAILGTPVYMSPEQIRGDGTIGAASDVYALGHIAYALLVGEPYWEQEKRGSSAWVFMNTVMAGVKEPPTQRAARRGIALPPAFDGWFARATAHAAADRFDRSSTLVAELGNVLGVAGAARSPGAQGIGPGSDSQAGDAASTLPLPDAGWRKDILSRPPDALRSAGGAPPETAASRPP